MSDWLGALVGAGADAALSPFMSAQSFAWNGKDLRRTVRYQKRMIRFQNQQNREQASWSAKEMPSLQMAGLRAAGLNPILSVTGSGGFSTPDAASASAADVGGGESYERSSGVSGDLDLGGAIDSIGNFFRDRKLARKERDTTESELDSRKAQAEANKAEAVEREKLAKTLALLNKRDIESRVRLSENSAVSSDLKALEDRTMLQFADHWLRHGIGTDFDTALKSYMPLYIDYDGHGSPGGRNELHEMLASVFRNRLRKEDWSFFNQQMDMGSNAASTISDVIKMIISKGKYPGVKK